MTVMWNALLNQEDPGRRFEAGVQQGRQRRGDRAFSRAVTGDPRGMPELARTNPQAYMQLQQFGEQKQNRAQGEQEAQRRQIAEAARALGPIYQQLAQMPYEQRRPYLQQVAPRLAARGIPEQMIAEYDPTDQNLQADIALSVQHGGEGFTLGEGQVRFDSTGRQIAQGPAPRTRYYPVAPGGRLVPDPAQGGAATTVAPPAPGTVEDGYRFRGGNPADPANWEPVSQGGASPSGSQTFPADGRW
jgi:hypothetical protein